jgi:hypothetical protein
LICTLPSLALVLGCLSVVTPNMVGIAAYLQPLAVANSLAFVVWRPQAPRRKALVWLFVSLAALASIRSIGMGSWGLVCAADVGYPGALNRVRAELGSVRPGGTVVVSAAYLYEAANWQPIRQIHSDWLHPAVKNEPNADAEALLAIKPAKLILTQFDYYRRYQGIVDGLKRQPDLVRAEVADAAQIRPPDASPSWQRVVQHISWAPVIVSFEWR